MELITEVEVVKEPSGDYRVSITTKNKKADRFYQSYTYSYWLDREELVKLRDRIEDILNQPTVR